MSVVEQNQFVMSTRLQKKLDEATELCRDICVYRQILHEMQPYNRGRLYVASMLTKRVCEKYPDQKEDVMRIYHEETNQSETRSTDQSENRTKRIKCTIL